MKKVLVILLSVFMVFITSCWDARELSEIGLVVATGFDLDENGHDKVTVLSVQPYGQGTGQVESATVWIGTASGRSAYEALRNLRNISTRTLAWMHNKIIILGKKKAESDISNIIDLITRNQEIRYDNTVLLTEGTAEELLHIPSDIDISLVRELLGIIDNTEEWSKGFALEIKDIAVESIEEHSQGFVIGNVGFYNSVQLPLSIDRQEYLKMYWKNSPVPIIYSRGGGVIISNRLAGWLSPNELRGYLFISDNIKTGVVLTVNLTDFGVDVAVEIVNSKTGISFPDVSPNNITAEINVKMECRISEIKGAAPEHSMDFIDELEKEIGTIIASEIYSTLNQAQNQFRADFTGLHKTFSKKHPKEWKEIKGNWCEYFSRIPVTCTVDAFVQNEGLLNRTFRNGGY